MSDAQLKTIRLIVPPPLVDGCTGDIEDAPGPQNLQKFKLELDGKDIYVTADVEDIKKNVRQTKPPKSAQSDKNGVVIVGGGSGALYAVEGLREVRFVEFDLQHSAHRSTPSLATVDRSRSSAKKATSRLTERSFPKH